MITFNSVKKYQAIQLMAVYLGNHLWDIKYKGTRINDVKADYILSLIIDMEGEEFSFDYPKDEFISLKGHMECHKMHVLDTLELKFNLIW